MTAVRAQAPQGVQNQGQAQQAASLPDGAAKELVARACTTCHGINQITNSDRLHQGALAVALLHDDQTTRPAGRLGRAVLSAHFPRSRDVNRCWCQARCRSRSGNGRNADAQPALRDPVQSPDGMIWWAGQYGNVVGRLNPRTGEMREWTLPQGARPHSIAADRSGSICAWGTPTAPWASSIRRQGRSPFISCRIPQRAILTRRFSTATAFCGSPSRTAT